MPLAVTAPKTLFDKVWEAHVVHHGDDSDLVFIDLHLVQEVSSPQAFAELSNTGRPVRRPDLTLATVDHSLPTTSRLLRIVDAEARTQVETLQANCESFGVPFFDATSERQGIVHVIGPELGLTQPGMTIACGDSHTTTHGAFAPSRWALVRPRSLRSSPPSACRFGGLPLWRSASTASWGSASPRRTWRWA